MDRQDKVRGSSEPEQQADVLRRKIEHQIDMAKAEIEREIARLKWQQQETELAEPINALEGQLAMLDQKLAQATSGNLAALQMLNISLPRAIGAAKLESRQIVSQASAESTYLLMEMTHDKIEGLQRSHDRQSNALHSYERWSFGRIEQLAAQNGVDISGIRQNRAQIQAEFEEAKRKGDRAGMFKADALLATNNVFGLVKTGAANDEIDEAKRKAAEARERYLKEREIEAMNAGRAQGLSGDQLKTHIDQARSTAATELDDANRKMAERAGLSPEEKAKALAGLTGELAREKGNQNQRTDEHSTDTNQATKTARSGDVLAAGDAKASAARGTVSESISIAGFNLGNMGDKPDKSTPSITLEADKAKHKTVEIPKVPDARGQTKGNVASV